MLEPGIREVDLYGGTRHGMASAYRSTSAQRKSKRQPCTAPTRPCSSISGRICENLRGYTRKPAHPVAQKDDAQNQQDWDGFEKRIPGRDGVDQGIRGAITGKAGKSVTANGLVLSLDKSSSTSVPRASPQFTFATRRQNVVYAGDVVRKNDWKLRP